MNLMIVPGILVCSSFLISVCMFIVSKALLISSATVIVRVGGAIWLNPIATVLFTVCSTVTVECWFCTRVGRVSLVCLLLCKEEASSPVSAITERRDMGVYEVPLSMSLLGFRSIFVNFHMCGIMLVLRAVFNMLGSTRGPMCFRCLMFNLSGPLSCYFFCALLCWCICLSCVLRV